MKYSLPLSILNLLLFLPIVINAQDRTMKLFLSDSSMAHASVSLCIIDTDSGSIVKGVDADRSLTPASVMKLITSGAALEMLGPGYRFTTTLGYRGTINLQTGILNGDIIIKGGGDPVLGSEYFKEHYNDFLHRWVNDIRSLGIKKIEGRIIADDSYFDFLPSPAGWLWEDMGNYYGAGVFGLSVYDNTVRLHFRTGSEGTDAVFTGTDPAGYKSDFINLLKSAGSTDEGYILAAPYSKTGWITGTIPVNNNDFVLKASIQDPPLFLAGQLTGLLENEGITVNEKPSSARLEKTYSAGRLITISEIPSPPLSSVIEVLNHESVNLIAETLLKQLGKNFRDSGSTVSGIKVIRDYFEHNGLQSEGLFMEDGSGLSPKDGVSAHVLASFLVFMKNKGKHFNEYFNSLPEAGRNGTLKYCFRDSLFASRLRAKSGSMERVRCYAGYFITLSGRQMAFAILINNFNGASGHIIKGIESVIGETIADN